MKISVLRHHLDDTFTLGKIFIDGQDIGVFTLEDKVREEAGIPVDQWKIPSQTAIPMGIYKVIVDFSKHFQKQLPHILDVPGFTGVRIHPGNTDLDTEGCILVGLESSGGDFIGKSREAFEIVFGKINAALAQNSEVEIEVASA